MKKILIVLGLVSFVIASSGCLEDLCGESRRTPIISLTLNGKVEGTFFLGSGSIEDEPVYYFYKEKEGGLILDYVYATETIVIETNDVEPVLVEYGCTFKQSKLYVPEGTIIRHMVMDTKDL